MIETLRRKREHAEVNTTIDGDDDREITIEGYFYPSESGEPRSRNMPRIPELPAAAIVTGSWIGGQPIELSEEEEERAASAIEREATR